MSKKIKLTPLLLVFVVLNWICVGLTLPIFVIGYIVGEFNNIYNYLLILFSLQPLILLGTMLVPKEVYEDIYES